MPMTSENETRCLNFISATMAIETRMFYYGITIDVDNVRPLASGKVVCDFTIELPNGVNYLPDRKGNCTRIAKKQSSFSYRDLTLQQINEIVGCVMQIRSGHLAASGRILN
jgi:hypothetical protein